MKKVILRNAEYKVADRQNVNFQIVKMPIFYLVFPNLHHLILLGNHLTPAVGT
jgi:hypothetical protein